MAIYDDNIEPFCGIYRTDMLCLKREKPDPTYLSHFRLHPPQIRPRIKAPDGVKVRTCMGVQSELLRTQRTRLYRKPDRGRYDRQTVNAILDEGLVCHLAFVREGHPYALPTIYGRDGDRLLVHGGFLNRARFIPFQMDASPPFICDKNRMRY
jgi:hypothetical protein